MSRSPRAPSDGSSGERDGRIARLSKALLVRGTEAGLAVGLVLAFFLVLLFLLGLGFREGTSLGDLMLVADSQGSTRGGAIVELDIDDSEPVIATLAETHNTVKDKPADAIVWAAARMGQPLEEGHAVQTFARSAATINFGEDEVVLDENSLVVIRKPQRRPSRRRRVASVVALEGELRGRLQEQAAQGLQLEVVTASGSTRVRPDGGDADFKVTVNPDDTATFSLVSGAAEVTSAGRTVSLGPNQTVTVVRDRPPGRPVALPGPPAPVSPGPAAVFFYRSLPPRIDFRWAEVREIEAFRFEIGRDPEFAEIVHEQRVAGTGAVHGNLPEGRYYWRVASLAGWADGPPTDVRRFEIVRDELPPALDVVFPDRTVHASRALLRGRAEPGAQVFVGDLAVSTAGNGNFEHLLSLRRGPNVVVVEAIDAAGNAAYRSDLVDVKYEEAR